MRVPIIPACVRVTVPATVALCGCSVDTITPIVEGRHAVVSELKCGCCATEESVH